MEGKSKKGKKVSRKERRAAKKEEAHKVGLTGPANDQKKLKKMVEELANKYGKTEDEIFYAYDQFMEKYPTGVISKKQFSDEMGGGILCDSVYGMFDEDNSGSMDFQENMTAKFAMMMSTPEEKLSWIFEIFDSDGGGVIEMDEIEEVVEGIFRFAGITPGKKMLDRCVIDVKTSLDGDGDGSISKEEFVANAVKSKFIYNMFIAE